MTKDVADLFTETRPDKKVAKLALGSIVTEYLTFYAEGRGHTARAKQLDTDKFLEFLKRFKRKKEIEELSVEVALFKESSGISFKSILPSR